MLSDYEKLFQKLGQIEPPPRLCRKIISQVQFDIRRAEKLGFIFSGLAAVASFAGIIMAARYTAQELNNSGFYQYISLIFSDTKSLISYWKDFGLLLVESMPVLAVAIVLATAWAFLSSIKILVKNKKHGYKKFASI